MSTKLIIDIRHLVSDEKCYETVRNLRWPDGTKCPFCQSKDVIKHGHSETCQ
ncbi:MAG: transposase [Magnetococcales bacterium]|nr:transposase [Magnetococcales bacterium]